jgi:hypothetical protein
MLSWNLEIGRCFTDWKKSHDPVNESKTVACTYWKKSSLFSVKNSKRLAD